MSYRVLFENGRYLIEDEQTHERRKARFHHESQANVWVQQHTPVSHHATLRPELIWLDDMSGYNEKVIRELQGINS